VQLFQESARLISSLAQTVVESSIVATTSTLSLPSRSAKLVPILMTRPCFGMWAVFTGIGEHRDSPWMRRKLVNYELIAIDVDGTLLNTDHVVSEANRAALHRAHEAGMQVVLCTGRAFPEIERVIDDIGLDLDAAVTVFGAVVTDVPTKETLHSAAFTDADARALVEFFKARDYTVLYLSGGEQAGSSGYVIRGEYNHFAVDAYLMKTTVHYDIVEHLPAEISPALRISIIDDPGALDEMSAELIRVFGDRVVHNILHAPEWAFTVIEAFAPGVNKWNGIARLCELRGLNPEKVVALGDDVNDIDMLRNAPLGVAMGNARESVKAAANRVTLTNNEDGVAKVIDEILQTE
jgi:Cof subfamily protein (haloacid dehalogenase superfamily)